MITLISTILGLISSLLPALVKLWEKRYDYKHELELRKLEIEAAAQGVALQARLEQIRSIIEQNRALYMHDAALDGNEWINTLRASVRPIITYAFFGLFVVIKTAVLLVAIKAGLPPEKIISIIWDEYTSSIFGAILGFWFGSRLWEKTDFLNNVVMTGTSVSRTTTKK